MQAYRIGSRAHPLLDGGGAAASDSARWNSRGKYVIYAAEHYATALLEKAAQLNSLVLPRTLVYVRIDLPDEATIEEVKVDDVADWDADSRTASQRFGDQRYVGTATCNNPIAMTLADALLLLRALERHGVAYVLVGSMAMAAHGLVRATRDIDIFVDPQDDNVARLKAALRQVFDDPEIDRISAEDLEGSYPAIQYAPAGADYWIDILARLGDAFRYDDLEAETVTVDGVPVRVATVRTLHRMKRDTVRPQDRLDADMLRERFDLENE